MSKSFSVAKTLFEKIKKVIPKRKPSRRSKRNAFKKKKTLSMIIEYEKEDSDDSKNESGLDVIDSA